MKPTINAFQLALLIVANRVASMTVFLPVVTRMTGGGRDAWIAAIISGVVSCGIAWLVVSLSRRHPDLTLIGMNKHLLGKWIGGLVSIIFLYYFLHVSIILIRDFAEVINTSLMPETPVTVFIACMTVASVYCVYKGLEGIVRTNSITLPFAVASIVLILVIVTGAFHSEELLPLLDDGWNPIWVRAIVPTAWSGEVILVTMLYPYIADKTNVMRFTIWSEIIVTVLLVFLAIFVVGVFGAREAVDMTLAVFSLARIVSIGDFFERIEAVMIAIWISTFLTKTSIFLYIGVQGTGEWLGIKGKKILIIPLAITAMILATVSYDSIADLVFSLSPRNWGSFALFTGAALPMILLMVSIIREKKVGS
ncbi:endospore germination permease [Paenibacillus sp. PAMC21692]|uniref:GerAB/ArcD/ProY family transporter n=1 Tax=Paenibacillus sp. PAMC21692 TaxID=2762320 RepID=UPI00164DF440|nr:endospore germination permease [Paenibacillus sp. PAMC21692]QNK57083.1 endospore germination permease [Paenibacillus sp. PAMC21692]